MILLNFKNKNFSAVAAVKEDGIRKSLNQIGQKAGVGDDGNIKNPYSSNDYFEDKECDMIEQEVRKANQSLESALPGRKNIVKFSNKFKP